MLTRCASKMKRFGSDWQYLDKRMISEMLTEIVGRFVLFSFSNLTAFRVLGVQMMLRVSTSVDFTAVGICIAFENRIRHFVKTTRKLPLQAFVFSIKVYEELLF